MRSKGLEEIEARENAERRGEEYTPKDTSLGLFEYSAPDDCDIWDRAGWAMANPSLGYPGGPTEETMAALASTVGEPGSGMPEHKFRTENLCQWVTVAAEGVFKAEDVERCTEAGSEISPESPIYLSIDVSSDRSMSYAAVAGWRDDGLPHVEVIAGRAYTEWVPAWLSSKLAFQPEAVIVQGRGAPASTIIDFIEQAGVDVTRCEGTSLANACGQFYDRVVAGTVRWGEQPDLLLALAEAQTKTLGDSWVFNREKSPVDISPLCAAVFALWGLATGAGESRQVSAYSDQAQQVDAGDSSEPWWL